MNFGFLKIKLVMKNPIHFMIFKFDYTGGFGSPFGAGPGGIGGPSGQFGPGGFGSPFMGQNFAGQQFAAGPFGGPQMSPFGQQQQQMSPFGISPFGPSRPFRSISDGRPVVFEQDDD